MGKVVCSQERERQSAHSPDCVKDKERLKRLIVSPHHIDERGKIRKSAFKTESLDKGFSVIRIGHATTDECEAYVRMLEEKGARVEKIALAQAGRIRKIRDGQRQQAFCVVDDGTAALPSHAHVVFSKNRTRPEKVELRKELRDIFVRDLTSFKGGLVPP